MLVLDSTVLIDYLRGRGVVDRVDSALEAGEMLATTSVNVEEIVRGLRSGGEEPARLLFEGLVVLDIGRREGWLAGEWRREAASKGTTLSQADCLIAATAWTAGARLATANVSDFAPTPVTVEKWPAT
ncbi:MAG: type II toxin-antitoxin system VapC family toxin [Acidimicrobiales bacterium]